ncbi:MAG: molybdopterin-dependent oxidoreductase [Candidatus Bathyarchaeota archaeon]|nr:molybdopterin-dependent oxidoreductase [Candidatus Bathyarchaeum sp.]
MKNSKSKNKWAILALIIGITFIGSAGAYYILEYVIEEPIDWEVTLIGSNGEQKVITYNDIRSLPYQDASGGYFTSGGIVYGPYDVRGVLLQDLCDLVGGISSDDYVSVTAPDGYSMAFGYEQVCFGGFPAWEPGTMDEVTTETQMILLTYKWEGKTIAHNDGGPLRLAVVTNETLLTEGHNWVMWVNEIEIKNRD